MSRATRMLLLLPTLLIALSCAGAGGQTRTVTADRFPGADLGAKINAADKSLGEARGEILVQRGGHISTQVVVSTGHTLRLSAGTYSATTAGAPFLLKPGASLVGAGRENTIILESTAPDSFVVVGVYNNAQVNGRADADVTVRGVQIKGANPGFNSAPQAISLGNCSRCTVDNVWLNGTRSIGVQLGGASAMGNFAQDSKIVNSLFTRVASQNIALTNGRNIVIENNRIIAPGQRGGPGSSSIDLEPNDAGDHLENVRIVNNLIDMRDSEQDTVGNGIIAQSASGTPHVGPIVIHGNTIIGGKNQGEITNKMSNGIYVFGPTMRDVTITNNTVTRTGQAGVSLEGTRLTMRNNKLTDVGGGGTPGFILVNVTDSQITDNEFVYTGAGPADLTTLVKGDSRGMVFERNRGTGIMRQ